MDVKRLVVDTLKEMEDDLERALDGLTPEDLSWVPAKWANSIGFTFWHVIRAEDLWIHRFARGVPETFAEQGWADKWGIPARDSGYGYDESKLADFPTPSLDELFLYYREVRRDMLGFLDSLTPDMLDEPLASPSPTGYSNGRMLGHLMSEIGQHVGHIRYLRGLQRGLDS